MARVAFVFVADARLACHLVCARRLLAHLEQVHSHGLPVAGVLGVSETRHRALTAALDVVSQRLRRLKLVDLAEGVEVLAFDEVGPHETVAQLALRVVLGKLFFLRGRPLGLSLSRQEGGAVVLDLGDEVGLHFISRTAFLSCGRVSLRA